MPHHVTLFKAIGLRLHWGDMGKQKNHPQRKTHDWVAIKRLFVEGITSENNAVSYPTMTELGKQYGLQASMIRRRAAKEGWVQARNAFVTEQEKVRQAALSVASAAAVEQRAVGLVARMAQLDEHSVTLAHTGLALVSKWMRKYQVGDQNAPIPADMQRAASALRGFQAVYRVACGQAAEGPAGGAVPTGGDNEQEAQDAADQLQARLDAAERAVAAMGDAPVAMAEHGAPGADPASAPAPG